jgi:hypothetical protein
MEDEGIDSERIGLVLCSCFVVVEEEELIGLLFGRLLCIVGR